MTKENKFDIAEITKQIKTDKRLMLVIGGALVLLVGMFLPWITVDLGDAAGILGTSFNQSINGIDANSFFPIVLLVIASAAALNLGNQTKKNTYITALAVSAIAFVVVLNDWPNTGSTLGAVSTGIGYYLSFIGSAAMTIGSGLLLKANMNIGSKPSLKTEK